MMAFFSPPSEFSESLNHCTWISVIELKKTTLLVLFECKYYIICLPRLSTWFENYKLESVLHKFRKQINYWWAPSTFIIKMKLKFEEFLNWKVSRMAESRKRKNKIKNNPIHNSFMFEIRVEAVSISCCSVIIVGRWGII